MPIELQIYRADEFIRLGAHGKLDLQASLNTLAALAKACQVRQISRGLLDVRGASAELTPNELSSLVRAFEEIGFTAEQRLAVLHRGDESYRARTFALIGRMRGWQVQAFDDFESALMWLSKDESQERNVAPKEIIPVAVPIRQDRKGNSGRKEST